jgi:serine/threonine protein kinase/formylglycine-generating enzyme required for sulfatase activity/tetratricopeptide (TPR) repeat protein
MSLDPRIFELLARWEDLRKQGQAIAAEELCRDFPHLLADVQRLIADWLGWHSLAGTRPGHGDGPGQTQPSGEPPPAGPEPPETIGRYRVEKVLGEGSFGRVYLAFDDQLKRPVAIKVPRLGRLLTPADIAAFLTEGQVVAALDHPHIVPVYDVGSTIDGTCFVVSKLVAGSDLKAKIQSGLPAPAEAAGLVAAVAGALHHAHRQGLIHRDVKPANILLDTAGKPYITDFGLALKEDDFGTDAQGAGTPAYMSPEQAGGEGHRVDCRSDVFSLGVVFYELLTGQRPFPGPTLADLIDQIQTVEPLPPRQRRETIPKELERICLKALAKRASQRYATARDLANDLRNWLHHEGQRVQGWESQSAGAGLPLPRPPRIVPKGLRSFDAADADFFLELLPGPRDRDGLPESIRFWKTRVEDRDAGQPFVVGLIYGPSGCGKSSLIKAGLLPRLAPNVRTVYVEATPDGTEARLLRGLRKRCPGVPAEWGLTEALASLRRGQGLPPDHKVLLILDQFEQWLHAHKQTEKPELVQALRQCDGERVQALVLVRDDFWMAATQFMQALEVRLLDGHNAAAVDLFDLRHAAKVLTAFGQAFGALPPGPAGPTKDQAYFLDQAVTGLAQDGKIIPVRLALFADMVKGKPWTPATWKGGGGLEGVGVAFLEETFTAATAPPEHRLHQRAAQAVLKTLLPEIGTAIKGGMRSRQELLHASGYAGRPRDFLDLLRILDTELRLVTPTDPEGADPARQDEGPRAPEQYYQLTHDYLVPALRQWLTRKQRESWRGRAEIQLAERTALWQAKADNRFLPTWWEWAAIRLGTQPRDWTPAQQHLMRRAGRYHTLGLAILLLVLTVAGWSIWEIRGSFRAAVLVDQLKRATIGQVEHTVDQLAPYRRWADSELTRMAAQATADDAPGVYAALALLAVHPDKADEAPYAELVRQRLLHAEPDEVRVLGGFLQRVQADTEPLWDVLKDPSAAPAARFRAGLALAGAVSGQTEEVRGRWKPLADFLAQQLVAATLNNPSHHAALQEGLKPVREVLWEPLREIFSDDHRPDSERRMATRLLADYAADQPGILAKLIKDADDWQYGVLFPYLKASPEAAAALLNNGLTAEPSPDWEDKSLDPAWKPPDQELIQQIDEAQGLVDERFALCQTLPLWKFEKVADRLGRCGFRPINFRPYAVGAQIQVAAVWTRDGRDWRHVSGVSAAEIRHRDADFRRQGYRPIDVAGYPSAAAGPRGQACYAALWAKGEGEDIIETRLDVEGVAEDLDPNRYYPRTRTTFLVDGTRHFCAIWVQPGKPWLFPLGQFDLDEAAYEGHLAPSNLQTDVRLAQAPKLVPRLQSLQDQLARADQHLKIQAEDGRARLQRAAALIGLGRDKEALPDLAALVRQVPQWGDIYPLRARANARLGKREEAHRDLAECRKLLPGPDATASLEAVVTAYLGEASAGLEQLESAMVRHLHDPEFLYRAGLAYGLAAEVVADKQPHKAKDYVKRAIELLRQAVADGHTNFDSMWLDGDLALLKADPGFRALLGGARLQRRYAAAWHESAEFVSEELHGLTPVDHRKRWGELAQHGYRPVALTVAAIAGGSAPDSVVSASVWHRPVVPEATRDGLAKCQARAAVSLLQLGHGADVWPLLAFDPTKQSDPRRRTFLIHLLRRLGADHGDLVEQLQREQDDSRRRALLLALGEIPASAWRQGEREVLAPILQKWYREDPDPGIHGAVGWLLHNWGKDADLRRIDAAMFSKPPAGRQRWYVNSQGQTLVVVPGPVEFSMGSPAGEADRNALDERLHRRKIPRSFAIGAKEVTVKQFLKFQPDFAYAKKFSPEPDCPINNVNWYLAAAYCNWLSDVEGIPKNQWCYPEKIGPGAVLPPGYLGLTGYRLPTEAEWEYACRAGATTSRYFGVADQQLLVQYGWFLDNAKERTQPGGWLKPNDLGLFDMYGNVYEWCQERAQKYHETAHNLIEDDEDILMVTDEPRPQRGGAFFIRGADLRSAQRGASAPPHSSYNFAVGFRVARTYP